MSQMKADRPATYLAGAVMASLWRFVKVSAEYTVVYCVAGERAFGVNIDTADAIGRGIAIASQHSGVSVKIEAGAAFAAGALLAPDINGRGVTAAGAAQYSGRALEAATALGDIVEIELVSGTA